MIGCKERDSGTATRLALSSFLLEMMMDKLTDEVRQEWTIIFADDIVICSAGWRQMEETLERRRYALEGKGIKVSRTY